MIVLADSDREFTARVHGQLGRHDVCAVDAVSDLDRLLTAAAADVSVVVLGPHVDPEEALGTAERLQAATPEVSVVVVAEAVSPELLRSALRAGARDVLPASFSEEQLRDTLARAEALSRQMRDRSGGGGDGDGERGRVATVFSAKGGVGKSFIASNLAVLLAGSSGAPVALVDLDLQFGDLAIMLQLFPGRGIYEAAGSLDHLDADALRTYLTPHRSGVHLLAAPPEPGLAEMVSAEAVERLLRLLRSAYPFVIVDTPAAFTDHVLAAVDASDVDVLVTSLDVPSIKSAKLALQTLHLLGIPRERLRLVLNRADSEVGLRVQDVERTLEETIQALIPSGQEVPLSINRGSPLAIEDPRSPVTAALATLAASLGAPLAPLGAMTGRRRTRFRLRRRVT